MRTTLSIDDDLLNLAKRLAEQRKLSISETFNFLIRRGLEAPSVYGKRNGFVVFDLQETPRLDAKDVERVALEDDAVFEPFFRGR